MSCKTSTRVAQVTGCLPLPVSHSWRISVLIRSASLRCLWAVILTLDPVLSSRRKVPNETYLVPISTGILITLPSVQVNLDSSGRVGLVPGWWGVIVGQQKHIIGGTESRVEWTMYLLHNRKELPLNGDHYYICCSLNIHSNHTKISMLHELATTYPVPIPLSHQRARSKL